ncbi:hypothetical protein JK386_00980 [Nocardioides sp. zg-536]|uniref:SecDF P1 head subdomain domain-containing protein n=1 Tax=Nocardioides faecalis TaxID=2803858 RepID=A0A938Y3H5_9ACTN|nr:hypothetical protein [Nocardioides faecalis]MBM9458467.1 hypothetical protein [Nocardioides faecalis]MBS4752798.1 hypothetical protein [Nocardioides faecalis]QVI58480.1 hypothetical protein KG111_16070 [Nocardioides faecalis]
MSLPSRTRLRDRSPGRRTASAVLVVALAAALAGGLSGCSDAGSTGGGGDGSGGGGGIAVGDGTARILDGAVQVRRVLESSTAGPTMSSTSTLPPDCADVPPGQPAAEEEAIACDAAAAVYRLAPADVVGGVRSAEAVQEPGVPGWVVQLELAEEQATTLAALSEELVGTDELLAILADGAVLSATTVATVIPDGRLQVAGGFDRARAHELAEALSD